MALFFVGQSVDRRVAHSLVDNFRLQHAIAMRTGVRIPLGADQGEERNRRFDASLVFESRGE